MLNWERRGAAPNYYNTLEQWRTAAQYAPVRWVRASERECAWAEPSVCCVSYFGSSTSRRPGGSSSTFTRRHRRHKNITVDRSRVSRFSFISFFFTSPMEGKESYKYEYIFLQQQQKKKNNKHPTCVCVCHADSTHLWLTRFLFFILKEIKQKKKTKKKKKTTRPAREERGLLVVNSSKILF